MSVVLNEARDSGSCVYNISSCIASFKILARKSSAGARAEGYLEDDDVSSRLLFFNIGVVVFDTQLSLSITEFAFSDVSLSQGNFVSERDVDLIVGLKEVFDLTVPSGDVGVYLGVDFAPETPNLEPNKLRDKVFLSLSSLF